MFRKLANVSVKFIQLFLPDPFVIVIILTLLCFLLGIPLTGQDPLTMIRHWGNGIWGFLAFSMQMALILVLGSAMANSPPVKKLLKILASFPETAGQAIVLTTAVSLLACWLSWGFGLIVGALIAKEIAKTGLKVDYPLLIATAYSGFLIWHGGLSGSVPLAIASVPPAGQAIANTGGILTHPIPTYQTIFAWWNIIICAGLFIILPLVNVAMHPKGDKIKLIDPALLAEEPEEKIIPKTPAEKLEYSPVILWFLIAFALIYLFLRITTKGFTLDVNFVNLIFLTLGMIFYGRPILYLRGIVKAVRGVGPILLLFPFYAGIQGLMSGATPIAAGGTGLSLVAVIANAFISISTQATYPLFTFLSASLIKIFVPSGGGQWAVQGPIMMPAGNSLGVAPAITAMAIAWGNSWANMIQPFWALPALGIAGLGARNVFGYTLVIMFAVGFLICGAFYMTGFVLYG